MRAALGQRHDPGLGERRLLALAYPWATEESLDRVDSTPQCLQTPEACHRIKQHVFQQLNDLLQYESSLADPEDRARHHAMRIAVKRLRYTLEISRPMCLGRLDEALETIKKVQVMLGDIHDCDVWLDHLDAFASRQRDRIMAMFGHTGRFLRLQPGIEYLLHDRRSHRQTTFDELVKYWAELKGQRFWDELAGAVDFDAKNGRAEEHLGNGKDKEPQMNTDSHG